MLIRFMHISLYYTKYHRYCSTKAFSQHNTQVRIATYIHYVSKSTNAFCARRPKVVWAMRYVCIIDIFGL
ncbi:hypothetical protein BDQ12DRAFT_672577 [Crucibulum laeve]|uniref:Uncharacterized protein n=1 Tax=Crucibulum laeve TaxID=68775 RepID=A0A5C3MG33_9AGAR|nr:hypothetical protein BDQ12DRAFT_672577 [Crucibulum laeve]